MHKVSNSLKKWYWKRFPLSLVKSGSSDRKQKANLKDIRYWTESNSWRIILTYQRDQQWKDMFQSGRHFTLLNIIKKKHRYAFDTSSLIWIREWLKIKIKYICDEYSWIASWKNKGDIYAESLRVSLRSLILFKGMVHTDVLFIRADVGQ